MEGNAGIMVINEIYRYDLNATYTLDERDQCQKEASSGNLPSPWSWIQLANFTGTTTFQGNTLDVWTYFDDHTVDTITLTISVYQTDPNTPVFFSEKLSNGTTITTFTMTYLEWNPSPPEEWVFYVPNYCQGSSKRGIDGTLGGDPASVASFANSQWDCTTPTCSARVPAGSAQPAYECAEFAARSLAYGGYIPGLSSSAPQSSYTNYKGHNLCLTTGLSDALAALGFKKLANSGSSVQEAVAIFGNAGDGYFSHACIGVGSDLVDCHNNARKGYTATGIMYEGLDAVYGP
jgi:hypothetical protein